MAKKTVLLIDDSAADRAALKTRLAAARDLAIYEASTGIQGIDLFRTVQPDCVVMELKIQDMIGLEAVNLIQAEMNGHLAPIFIWTRLHHDMLRYAASSLGLRGYFQKGTDLEDSVANAVLEAIAVRS